MNGSQRAVATLDGVNVCKCYNEEKCYKAHLRYPEA